MPGPWWVRSRWGYSTASWSLGSVQRQGRIHGGSEAASDWLSHAHVGCSATIRWICGATEVGRLGATYRVQQARATRGLRPPVSRSGSAHAWAVTERGACQPPVNVTMPLKLKLGGLTAEQYG